jgi:hypothetical protein
VAAAALVAVVATVDLTACWRPSVANASSAQQDEGIVKLRQRYVGHVVYAYGNIGLMCAPGWTRVYRPGTALHVVAIERERAGLDLGTGSQYGLAPYGVSFFEPHPVRVVFAVPHEAPVGTNFKVDGLSGRCPAIDLAEFQFPLAFDVHPPEKSALRGGLRVGMSRQDVIWQIGYPWEPGDQRQLLSENAWHYGVGLSQQVIQFKNNRVSSIHTNSAH